MYTLYFTFIFLLNYVFTQLRVFRLICWVGNIWFG
jgi:hypothetical protein